MRHCRVFLVGLLLLPLPGCYGYRMLSAEEIATAYEPRPVAIPEDCEPLIQRAAAEGLATMTEAESRTVSFCQTQQIIRAQEEEAVARKLEAHAATARFALQLATVVIGATIAVLAWVF